MKTSRNPWSATIDGLTGWHAVVFAILALALALRLWGIDFGLPHIYDTDEGFEVRRALKLGVGEFEFDRIGKGGYYYLLFVLYGAYYVTARVMGTLSGSRDFLLAFFDDPTPFWLIGRVPMALIGTLHCWLLYVLGRRWHSSEVGLVAAIVMAVHPLHVAYSHVITVEMPMATAVTALFVVVYRCVGDQRPPIRDYLSLGVLLAVATACKITAGPAVFAVLGYHWLNVRAEGLGIRALFDRRLAAFGLAFLVIYGIGVPGIVAHAGEVVQFGLSFLAPSNSASPPDLGLWTEHPMFADRVESRLMFYWTALFPLRYAVVAMAFAAGLVSLLLKGKPRRHLALLFLVPVVYFLVNTNTDEHIYDRYLLSLTPFIWLYAAYATVAAWRWACSRFTVGRVVVVLAAMAGIAPMAYDTLEFDRQLTLPDTRTLAKQWFEDRAPAGSVVYLAGGGVSASPLTVPLDIAPELVDPIVSHLTGETDRAESEATSTFYEVLEESLANKKTYRLVLLDNAWQLEQAMEAGIGDWAIFRAETLALVSDAASSRWQAPELRRLVQWIGSEFEPVQSFVADGSTTGPDLLIYRRRRADGNGETHPNE